MDPSVTASDAEATILAAIDAGVTMLDTAAAYSTADEPTHNEELIRRVLASRPTADVLVATKGGHTRHGAEWQIDGSADALRSDCERSLRALGVERLDLYYLHKPDPMVPLEESVGALESLRQEGKIALVGLSNVSLDQLHLAVTISPIGAVQNQFSPLNREDLACIDECERRGIAYTVYSPLGGPGFAGGLAARLPRSAARAAALGISLQRHLLGWELSLAAAIIPIVGSRRPASIIDSAKAGDDDFDEESRAALARDLAAL
jgi:aryl-alcohol dehydrogenase-like predicted oxidoreductase